MRPHFCCEIEGSVCARRRKFGGRPDQGLAGGAAADVLDFAIEPPQPMPPHVKMVGGILTAPAKPLPADLEARARARPST